MTTKTGKHTEGPWSVLDNSNVNRLNEPRCGQAGYITIHSDSGDKIARVEFESGNLKQDIANAHLIASAPELLEACKRLLWARSNPYQCNMDKAVEEAEQAIAKAEKMGG